MYVLDKVDEEEKGKGGESGKAISFHRAFMIPGVIEFSLCLFSAKLVFYVFLFWLPHYIRVSKANHVEVLRGGQSLQIQFEDLSDQPDSRGITEIANYFDYGAMLGGIIAGFLSDQTRG